VKDDITPKEREDARARRALARITLPLGARSMPRPGGLKAAILVVVYKSKRPLVTDAIGASITKLSWAPVGWTKHRLATYLGELRRDALLEAGPETRRASDEPGPIQRKTWRRPERTRSKR
jgi:hypothetical protein